MPRESPDIPPKMQKVLRRFERWRSAHTGRLPIPKRLWNAAVKLAREHGVFHTAKALRLEYGKLKRMVESDGLPIGLDPRQGHRIHRSAVSVRAKVKGPDAKVARARSAASLPSFLEVVGSSAIAGSECVIELEGAQGKMRIQWNGIGAPDLAALGRVLLEPRTR